MTKTERRGGHREGAGRKPSPCKKVCISAYVRPEVAAGMRRSGVKPGAVIEDWWERQEKAAKSRERR